MKKIALICAFTAFFCASPQLSAQKVYADKTTSEGRTILTKESEYIGAGRDDMISLNYFSHGDTEIFQLHIAFDESNKQIKEGYKMLLKQESGNIIELTCHSGERKDDIQLVPFIWLYDVTSFEDTNYLLTREQVQSIIDDPIRKMRVEYHQGYFDIGVWSASGSKFSSFIEKAYKAINEALETKKTGLYDGF